MGVDEGGGGVVGRRTDANQSADELEEDGEKGEEAKPYPHHPGEHAESSGHVAPELAETGVHVATKVVNPLVHSREASHHVGSEIVEPLMQVVNPLGQLLAHASRIFQDRSKVKPGGAPLKTL
jgi:hypothetical protein